MVSPTVSSSAPGPLVSASPPGGPLAVAPVTPAVSVASVARPELLSTLWVFVMLNYLYADVLSLMDPILLPQWVDGHVDGLTITRPFLLGAAVLMEVPMAMVVLSRVLPWRQNRWANLGAGAFQTIVVGASLFVGRPNIHYLFFASIEMLCTSGIVVLAWRWRRDPFAEQLNS
jgi:hypothetical protein